MKDSGGSITSTDRNNFNAFAEANGNLGHRLFATAGVGFDQIGPVSALTLMLQSLGGPLVLAVVQAVITLRTLYLGGTTGPVKFMNEAQLHALDKGYTYGLLWVAGAAVIVGCAALFIRYTPEQVAHAQEVKEAIDAGEI